MTLWVPWRERIYSKLYPLSSDLRMTYTPGSNSNTGSLHIPKNVDLPSFHYIPVNSQELWWIRPWKEVHVWEGGQIQAGKRWEHVRPLSPDLGDLHPSGGSLGGATSTRTQIQHPSVLCKAHHWRAPSEMHQVEQTFFCLCLTYIHSPIFWGL